MERKSHFKWILGAVMMSCGLLQVGCASPPATMEEEPLVIALWNGAPPLAETLPADESRIVKDHGWRFIVEIHNVSAPTMTMIRPREGKANGSAMLILPGGAFSLLAWDLEGTEVADFLVERGVTAFVLKYRVREPTPEEVQSFIAKMSLPENASDPAFFVKQLATKQEPAVADALQAMRLVRTNADQYGIDPDRIGMMGFSAGAITTFAALQRSDAATRPDIAAPIYGLAFDPTVPADAPPLFMAVAKDDEVMAAASADIQEAWQAAGEDSELHVFESGGHGFGMGRPGTDSMQMSALLEVWLRENGFLL